MTTLFSPQSKGCVHSRKKVAPLITTLFLTSIKGVCAFNEECGAPSPCFPIKGGGEPHFWVFTFWEGETLALPYLNPFIPPSSSRVRVRAFVVARVLASLRCWRGWFSAREAVCRFGVFVSGGRVRSGLPSPFHFTTQLACSFPFSLA